MKTITAFLFFIVMSCNSHKTETMQIICDKDTIVITGNFNTNVSKAHSGTSGHNDTVTNIFTVWINQHDTTYVGYPLNNEKEK